MKTTKIIYQTTQGPQEGRRHEWEGRVWFCDLQGNRIVPEEWEAAE